MKINIITEFKKNLKERINNPYLASVYLTLFSLLTDEELLNVFECYKSDYEEDKEEWFSGFHKALRQGDFFHMIRGYRVVDKLTDEQHKRRNFLLAELKRMRKEYTPSEELEVFKTENTLLKAMPEYVKLREELFELNGLLNSQENVRISGVLDSILWCVVQLDEENELADVMELTFKMCKA